MKFDGLITLFFTLWFHIIFANTAGKKCNIVFVLTVWRRNFYDVQFELIKQQSALREFQEVCLIIFQNGNHVHVRETDKKSRSNISIYNIHSNVETGYHGRFLAPLTVNAESDAFFVVLDDDVQFGSKYIENMLRVVRKGHLATRMGRWLDKDGNEEPVENVHLFWRKGKSPTVLFNDTLYDFGAHLWAGRISWLKLAWHYPPVTYETGEDFWLSAVLRVHYNISTVSPGCPPSLRINNDSPSPLQPDLDYCACSHKTAATQVRGSLGNFTFPGGHVNRRNLLKKTMDAFHYRPLLLDDPGIIRRSSLYHRPGPSSTVRGCIWWYG